MTEPTERLNKYLANLGIGSRRAIDAMIGDGRISVNGTLASLGQRVKPTDTITLDDKPVTTHAPEKIIIALHKPRGITTTKKDPFAKVTVMDLLPPKWQHLNPVGRLDRASRGLLLLTNDGDIAYALEHPKYQHEKEYKVEVIPQFSIRTSQFEKDIQRLSTEIINSEIQTKPPRVVSSHFNPLTQRGSVVLVLEEGKKRQIRRMFSELGYFVNDLVRTRINNVELDTLKEGEYRVIDHHELKL